VVEQILVGLLEPIELQTGTGTHGSERLERNRIRQIAAKGDRGKGRLTSLQVGNSRASSSASVGRTAPKPLPGAAERLSRAEKLRPFMASTACNSGGGDGE
jgi:hypothetical protein